MYTDVSKGLDEKIGVSYVIPEFDIKVAKRVNENLSLYTGEMLAILLALQWVEEVSSSIASLQGSTSNCREDIVLEIR